MFDLIVPPLATKMAVVGTDGVAVTVLVTVLFSPLAELCIDDIEGMSLPANVLVGTE
jgi:hypothetical protein